MPMSSGGPDPKVEEHLKDLLALQKAGGSWFWRTIAIAVSFAAIISAVFQVLIYAKM